MRPLYTLLAASVLAVCLPPHSSAADEPLGRLFFTPEQRARLDAGIAPRRPAATRPASPPVRRATRPAGPGELRVGGVVTRSDGERTVWIDGKPYHRDAPSGIRILTNPTDPATVRVLPGNAHSPLEVRVGQTLDARSGEVRESYMPTESGRPAD